MTPQELKNSILQLAIQGKLVEQRADEGTGAELLEKILAAKGRGIKLTRSRGARGGGETEVLNVANVQQLPISNTSFQLGNEERGMRKLGIGNNGNGNISTLATLKNLSAFSASPREEIPDNEKPFDIPESWEWVRLGEIVFNHGQKKPTEDFSYVDIGSIDNKHQKLSDAENIVKPEKASPRARKIIQKGDILYSTVRPYLHNICIVDREFSREPIASTGFAVMACSDCLDNKFLFYFLLSPDFDRYANSTENAKGVAYPAISDKRLYNATIPLPPLAEQKRIVAKIEELLPLIDGYEKAWSRLEDFNKRFPVDMQKSLLQMAIQGKLVEQRAEDGTGAELLEKILAAKNAKKNLTRSRGARGDAPTSAPSASPREEIPDDEKPFDIPESWEWARLGEIFVTSSGTTPLKSNADYYSNQDYNWVRTTDLNNGILTSCEIKISRKAFEECRLSVIPIDSVCVAMYGGAGTIGKNAIIKFDTTINQSVCAIQPNGFCDMSFVQKFLQVYRPFWMKMAAGSRKDPNINQVIIKNALFPLPPFAEQKRIVAKLEELLPLCERLKFASESV